MNSKFFIVSPLAALTSATVTCSGDNAPSETMVKLSLLALITPVMAVNWVTLSAKGDGAFDQFNAWAKRTCQNDQKGQVYSSSDIYGDLSLNCYNVPQSWCDSYNGGKNYHPSGVSFTSPKAGKCYQQS
ncbi:hypothetical protein BDP55DRAFT_772270 [Colletotrichum godetiae]|uniref:Secreted protein n=1 Tax=Colletotrichum godetiae TaxID=1209918 RepID=A0AAJ0AB12_9PEZI|nr:uncharacterized protein BDP55DRAFT_772270 [Colletotrichum godetiae]KAK1659855.1 hypothetical protein BDP55DRAFT_772270 [Colletotrichum godetiae]